MKIGRVVLGGPRHLAMAALRPLETRLLQASDLKDCSVVFVIGPPRSGTTLLLELLITRYQFSYFSNLAHRLYQTPAAATFLGRRLIRRWQGEFRSEFGHIPGWGSPCEGGWIWQRWLRNRPGIGVADVAIESQRTMQRTIASIAHSLHAPFLSKNVEHSIHIRALSSIFPKCCFIQIIRDRPDVVQSILRARKKLTDPIQRLDWWSVKPRDWELYEGEDPTVQACAQVILTQRSIDADVAAIGEDRRHIINYKSLCRSTHEVLEGVARFLESRGTRITQRGSVPHSFVRSGPIDDPSPGRARVNEVLDSLVSNDAKAGSLGANQANECQASFLARRTQLDEEPIA